MSDPLSNIKQMARDPATSPALLHSLAVQSNLGVLRPIIASNPNANLETLRILADWCPYFVLQNKALGLFLIESPTEAIKVVERCQQGLLRTRLNALQDKVGAFVALLAFDRMRPRLGQIVIHKPVGPYRGPALPNPISFHAADLVATLVGRLRGTKGKEISGVGNLAEQITKNLGAVDTSGPFDGILSSFAALLGAMIFPVAGSTLEFCEATEFRLRMNDGDSLAESKRQVADSDKLLLHFKKSRTVAWPDSFTSWLDARFGAEWVAQWKQDCVPSVIELREFRD